MTKHKLNLEDSLDMKAKLADLDISDLIPDAPESCAECPWNKFCLEAPDLTKEEAGRLIKEELPTGDKKQDAMLVTWVREKLISMEACSRFIEKAKRDGELVKGLKKVMKGEAEIVEVNNDE